MFRKRVKKKYPEGTFIATPARVCAILQLCLAFSAILWIASEPFVGEIFTLKSHLLYYQDVMGIPSHTTSSEENEERLARNAERFGALPAARKLQLQSEANALQDQLQRTFFDKMKRAFSLFSHRLPPFEAAWILLSIALPIMLLKKVEGASLAVWLLPLLVAAYAVDIRLFDKKEHDAGEAALFPKESALVAVYLGGELSHDLFEQQAQLRLAWKKYLAENWAKEKPSGEGKLLERQAEEGEYRFTLARLEARAAKTAPASVLDAPQRAPSLWLLLAYFFWNAYFAYTSWKFARPGAMGAIGGNEAHGINLNR